MKIKFPSYIAAFIIGFLWLPIYMQLAMYMSENGINDFIEIIAGIFGFVFPVILATMDKSIIFRDGTSLFSIIRSGFYKKGDLEKYYIPAWLRIFTLFISTVISMLILKYLGLNIIELFINK